MHRSKQSRIDWRGWVALAWALWFAAEYAKMVAAQRGTKLQSLLSRVTATAAREPEKPRQ